MPGIRKHSLTRRTVHLGSQRKPLRVQSLSSQTCSRQVWGAAWLQLDLRHTVSQVDNPSPFLIVCQKNLSSDWPSIAMFPMKCYVCCVQLELYGFHISICYLAFKPITSLLFQSRSSSSRAKDSIHGLSPNVFQTIIYLLWGEGS